MVDGAAVLTTMIYAFRSLGAWADERGTNILDTGAHFYDVYECSDGEYISLGSIESQFYAEMCEKLGIRPNVRCPARQVTLALSSRSAFVGVVRTKTRDEWCAIMDGSDACASRRFSRWPRRTHIRITRTGNTYSSQVHVHSNNAAAEFGSRLLGALASWAPMLSTGARNLRRVSFDFVHSIGGCFGFRRLHQSIASRPTFDPISRCTQRITFLRARPVRGTPDCAVVLPHPLA